MVTICRINGVRWILLKRTTRETREVEKEQRRRWDMKNTRISQDLKRNTGDLDAGYWYYAEDSSTIQKVNVLSYLICGSRMQKHWNLNRRTQAKRTTQMTFNHFSFCLLGYKFKILLWLTLLDQIKENLSLSLSRGTYQPLMWKIGVQIEWTDECNMHLRMVTMELLWLSMDNLNCKSITSIHISGRNRNTNFALLSGISEELLKKTISQFSRLFTNKKKEDSDRSSIGTCCDQSFSYNEVNLMPLYNIRNVGVQSTIRRTMDALLNWRTNSIKNNWRNGMELCG